MPESAANLITEPGIIVRVVWGETVTIPSIRIDPLHWVSSFSIMLPSFCSGEKTLRALGGGGSFRIGGCTGSAGFSPGSGADAGGGTVSESVFGDREAVSGDAAPAAGFSGAPDKVPD